MRELIDRLILLNPDQWHMLTMKMSWHYRTQGQHSCPAVVLAAYGGEPPTPEQWRMIRVTTTAARKSYENRVNREAAQARIANRRKYMRQYMRKRRSGNPTTGL